MSMIYYTPQSSHHYYAILSFLTNWLLTLHHSMHVHVPSHVCQAPLSTGFPRQEYWSVLPFPSPGYLPDSGINPIVQFKPQTAKQELPFIMTLKYWVICFFQFLLWTSNQQSSNYIWFHFSCQISTKIFQYYYYYSYHSMYSFLISFIYSFLYSFSSLTGK